MGPSHESGLATIFQKASLQTLSKGWSGPKGSLTGGISVSGMRLRLLLKRYL